MATQWTAEQREAIENRGGTLLVSAAAGSGKTAVLVERVLRRLTDPADPADIDRFLMVTYTNAAAAELRGKIADALTARLAQSPDDARLRRQLFLVHRAQITTVHAFCLNLAREQFAALGIAPDFRIADQGESLPLMDEVLDTVLETLYEQEDAGFLALSDQLTAGRDDKRLHEVVRETYGKIQAHPRPDAFLARVRAGFAEPAGDPAQTPHGQVLLREARLAAAYGLSCLDRAIAELENDDALRDAYLPAFLSDRARAQELLDAAGRGDWDGAVALAQGVGFDRLKSVRGYEDKQHLEALKAQREEWKGAAKKIAGRLLCVTAAEAEEDRARVAPAMCALADTVARFTEAFAAEKRRRNLVDFNDLEHFAIRLLLDADGAPTELARSLSAQFTEVLVDEYQDTNAVQDAIFSAVSDGGKRLFMVGDVKQSIYSFRLANPYIFLSKYQAFADADAAADGAPRRVVLSRNFRSRGAVLDTTNYIFRSVMSREVGDLDYDAREMLYRGADFPDADDPRYDTELCVIDAAKDPETGETPDKAQAEARAVAQRIAGLLRGGFPVYDKTLGRMRPAVASDCTILLRSVKSKAAVYARALEEAGLSAQAADSTGLLAAVEVRAVVSLLGVIDNPRQDVELIGALRSPLFGFTEQRLAEIRLLDKKACFYDAFCLAAQQGGDAARFAAQLARWRLLAADLPVYQILQMLYDETGALGVYGALPNGAKRQENLLAFFERARAYEAQGHRGLFRFLNLLRGMLANGEDFPAAGTEPDGGAVRIMSIHKSKGLEFPVVFLADCAKSFNESDLYAPVLVHSELGFGPKCRDMERGIQYPTMQRLAIAAQARREQVSEELRILYVGMTRAREKLVVTCASGSAISSLKKWAPLAALDKIPPYALGAARSTALWLLTPLLRHPAAGALREWAEVSIAPDTDAPGDMVIRCLRAADCAAPALQKAASGARSLETPLAVHPPVPYPGQALRDIPAKLTATGIKKGFKAEEAAEYTPPTVQREKTLRRPFFDQAARGLAPSEVGTAHHLFMQFADFGACGTPDAVKCECARLAERHILSAGQAAAIDAEKIAAFFQSALYLDAVRSGKLRREFKFSVLAPAAQFYPGTEGLAEEQVLLQGVIDCLIEREDGFVVVDFKTDRVSLATAADRAASYRPQLDAYAYAVEQIFSKPVTGRVIYFFHTKQCIPLP
ncbi:helicase-exonuclease AddAB subunit AddA [Intestinibacillus massiliensis]|nr:helicase-exonuclease AddAB subunit AddA [Intestinibacillus massiliensis]